ncbi:MAG: hypothetical protein ABL874_01025 [Sphingopyxis sp.]
MLDHLSPFQKAEVVAWVNSDAEAPTAFKVIASACERQYGWTPTASYNAAMYTAQAIVAAYIRDKGALSLTLREQIDRAIDSTPVHIIRDIMWNDASPECYEGLVTLLDKAGVQRGLPNDTVVDEYAAAQSEMRINLYDFDRQ